MYFMIEFLEKSYFISKFPKHILSKIKIIREIISNI